VADQTKKTKKRKPNVGSDPTMGSRTFWWQIGVYAFALGASGLLIGLTLFRLLQGRFTPAPAVAAVVVAGMSWVLLTASDTAKYEPGGIPLGSSEPELAAFLHSIADDIGAPRVDAIQLVTEPLLTILEETRYFGLKHDRRILLVGLPFLHSMTKQEIASLTAHHLGHWADGHVDNGVKSMRALRAGAKLIQMERQGVVEGVFGSYARKMSRSVGGVGVAQEEGAERVAYETYGSKATLSGLYKIDDVSSAWDDMLRDYVVPSLQNGLHPADLFDGFEQLLASSARAQARSEDVARRQADMGSEFDPHNTPGHRYALVSGWPAVAPAVTVEDSDALGRTLLDGAAKSEAIVVGKWANALIDQRTEPQSWDELADQVFSPQTYALAERGVDAEADYQPAALLDQVIDWSGADWDPLDERLAKIKALRKVSTDARRRQWVQALVLEAAAKSSRHRWQHSWDGLPTLVTSSGDVVPADALTELVLDGQRHEARALISQLDMAAV